MDSDEDDRGDEATVLEPVLPVKLPELAPVESEEPVSVEPQATGELTGEEVALSPPTFDEPLTLADLATRSRRAGKTDDVALLPSKIPVLCRSVSGSSRRNSSVIPRSSSTGEQRSSMIPGTSMPINRLPPTKPRRKSMSAGAVPSASAVRPRGRSASNPAVSMMATSSRDGKTLSRYLAYDQSPRYQALKAENTERRRVAEEKTRALAAAAKPSPPRLVPSSVSSHSRLDHVRSRLFDFRRGRHSAELSRTRVETMDQEQARPSCSPHPLARST